MSHELDFLESVRATLYPKLHSSLSKLGLYSVGKVGERQYVATLSVTEDAIEKELLHNACFQRSLLAAYKSHRDGRDSTLSLRLVEDGSNRCYNRKYVEEGMQLHLTALPAHEDRDGKIDLYAHYEDDWASSPIAHLRAKNFSAVAGVKKATALLHNSTYFKEGDDYTVQKL